MTTNELLTPRYECIAPYPHMGELKVGDILESLTNNERMFGFSYNYVTLHPETKKATERFFFSQPLSAFPANFRPMHWSEGRAVEDMPEYVNDLCGNIYKVERWQLKKFSYNESLHCASLVGEDYTIWSRYCLPATLAEYEAYQNSKTT